MTPYRRQRAFIAITSRERLRIQTLYDRGREPGTPKPPGYEAADHTCNP